VASWRPKEEKGDPYLLYSSIIFKKTEAEGRWKEYLTYLSRKTLYLYNLLAAGREREKRCRRGNSRELDTLKKKLRKEIDAFQRSQSGELGGDRKVSAAEILSVHISGQSLRRKVLCPAEEASAVLRGKEK